MVSVRQGSPRPEVAATGPVVDATLSVSPTRSSTSARSSTPVKPVTPVTPVTPDLPARPAPVTPLFRPEVLTARRTQWLGRVILAPRLSYRLFALFALTSVTAVLALLFLAQYTRTARLDGWLQPEQGVTRVHAARSGVVTQVMVTEGQAVRRGDPLLILSDETHSAALGATQASIAGRLAERRDSLMREKRSLEALFDQQRRALASRITVLHGEVRRLEDDIALLGQRVAIAERAEALHQVQYNEGFISDMRLQQVQSERLEQQARRSAAERSLLTASRERMVLEAERADVPLRASQQIAALDRGVAEIAQQLAQTESARQLVVTAEQDGTVTAIQAVRGALAQAGLPLLLIVPPKSELEVHLYGRSEAIGFVRPGQPVRLRFDAYPFQRFGQYPGVVVSVSRAALGPSDLPDRLSSRGAAPIGNRSAGDAALYRVTVRLASQDVVAYGEVQPLQAGMSLEASIALERRPLYQWVLDPLYTLSGRISG